mmetsp:Transcript_22764/g.29768  ORF Transcript_22764/g.29768 Transcript_22764/m.29768 type:complete len:116 (-) Transcript_22764:182-529(-)
MLLQDLPVSREEVLVEVLVRVMIPDCSKELEADQVLTPHILALLEGEIETMVATKMKKKEEEDAIQGQDRTTIQTSAHQVADFSNSCSTHHFGGRPATIGNILMLVISFLFFLSF